MKRKYVYKYKGFLNILYFLSWEDLNFHPFRVTNSLFIILNIFHLSRERTSFIGKSLLKTITILGVFIFKSRELYFEHIICPSLIPSKTSYGTSDVIWIYLVYNLFVFVYMFACFYVSFLQYKYLHISISFSQVFYNRCTFARRKNYIIKYRIW